MAETKTIFEDPDARVEVQVWKAGGGWKATHSVSMKSKGHSSCGNPKYKYLKAHQVRHAAIRQATQRAAETVLEDSLFSGLAGLRAWAEMHQPKTEQQAELFT